MVSVPRRLFQGVLDRIGRLSETDAKTEGGYNHDLAKRESAPGSRLGLQAVSRSLRGGPDDDKDGQEAWFTARIASQ